MDEANKQLVYDHLRTLFEETMAKHPDINKIGHRFELNPQTDEYIDEDLETAFQFFGLGYIVRMRKENGTDA